MGLADTAQLAVDLTLAGNFNAGLGQSEASLTRFNTVASGSHAATAKLSGGFTTIGSAAGKVGGALEHAGSQLKGLITGPLGMIGLAGGLFTVGGALESGISKAQSWGLQIEKLQGITHDSAETLSGLLAVTEKYGLSNERLAQIAGFTEKSLGNLAANQKQLTKFQADFGFQIVDSTGKVKDFNTILLQFADYWNNKAIPASEKAAAAAKLFGRGYADLVPILNLGAKGIQDAAQEAAALGLTLTSLNVNQLAQMRENTRQLGDAVGGLELQIGLALIPTVNDLAQSLTRFISDHRTDIVNFFKNAAAFGKEAAKTIGQVAGTLGSAWNAIPPELRDFLIKGVVADRTIKFLFGFDPVQALGSVFTKGLGSLFNRGSTPLNPMYVQQVGLGAGGSGLPGVAGGLGLGGLLTSVLGGTAIALELKGGIDALTREFNDIQNGDFAGALHAVANLSSPGSIIANGLGLGDNGPARNIGQLARGPVSPGFGGFDLDTSLYKTATAVNGLAGVMEKADWLRKLEASWTKAGQTMHDKITEAIKGLSGPNASSAAAFLGSKLGNAGFGAGGYDLAVKTLDELKNLHTKDPAVLAAIKELTARLPRLKTDKADLAAAEKEANSADPKNVKLDRLNAIMADLRAHGDRTTQQKVEGVINAVKHQKLSVTVPTSTRVSIYIPGVGTVVRNTNSTSTTNYDTRVAV